MLKGISVTLHVRTRTGVDPFNKPIFSDSTVQVDNVLVAPTTNDDIPTALNLDGKKAVYTLAIPKGDNHDWENTTVEFFGESWHTIGFVQGGIDELVPLDWNKKIMVERYGQS